MALEGAANDGYFRLEYKYAAKPQLKVILTASMLQKELGPKYTVIGTKGSLEKYGKNVEEQSMREDRRPGDANWGQEPETQYATFTDAASGIKETISSAEGSYEVFYANVADVNQPFLICSME